MLHVTPRTIRYWISGTVTVPYAAYRLVRVMRLFELPCKGWEGWHMHSGKLWSPEGHGFTAHDSNWWGLLCSKARLFGEMYERERQFNMLMQRTKAVQKGIEREEPPAGASEAPRAGGASALVPPSVAGGGRREAPALDLSLRHFGAYKAKTEQTCGLQPDRVNPKVVTNGEDRP